MGERLPPLQFTYTGADQREAGSVLNLVAVNGDTTTPVYFKTEDAVLSLRNEALVCLGLLPCLKTGRNLRIEGPLNRQFSDSLETILDVYCSWEPSFSRAEVVGVTAQTATPRPGRGVGVFFTGGLDSFYTLLKHRDEITHIIFVHGIDVNLKEPALRSEISRMLQRVGAHFSVKVIEIEANLRDYFESFDLHWGKLSHGPAFAATAYLLSPLFHRVYMPSSYTYAELTPWGSHCLLDPLWSSDNMEFIHDGCEATRIQKAALVGTSDIALNSLRVCFHSVHNAYNCGECEKCLRTMVNLYAVGALARCSTFPGRIDIKRLKRMSIFLELERDRIRENLRALEGRPEARELVRGLQVVLNRPRWRGRLNQQFWRRLRVWRRSIRRRLGQGERHVQLPAGGDAKDD